MKVFSAEQIRAWDQYTLQHEPVSSVDLMERASGSCTAWMKDHGLLPGSFLIFCGRGNNGGDGLAMARQLMGNGSSVQVLLAPGKDGSPDFRSNLLALRAAGLDPVEFVPGLQFELPSSLIVIDALFGTGLNRPPEGSLLDMIRLINQLPGLKISIDLPSGMLADDASDPERIVKADYTLSFQSYKKALLMQENAPFCGQVIIRDIALDRHYEAQTPTNSYILGSAQVQQIFQPRKNYAHKGTYGHVLLIGGSRGRIGAISMSTHAALRTGAGLTTVTCPAVGLDVLQIAHPEAMVIPDRDDHNITVLPPDLDKFKAIGIGPGLGQEDSAKDVLRQLLKTYPGKLVIDADALNMLGSDHSLLDLVPALSILTPHPKEFDRIFGQHASDFERTQAAHQHAVDRQLIIVLKSHHTCIALPDGRSFYNMTGNAGMAKGGSGDVLTGILASLLAQGYEAADSALLGVYLHGLAGDFAAARMGKESMLPTDLVLNLKDAFRTLSGEFRLPDEA